MCQNASCFSAIKTSKLVNIYHLVFCIAFSFVTAVNPLNDIGNYIKRDSLTNDDFYFRKAWPNGVVIYEISPKFDANEQLKLEKGMEEISERSCVKFRPRNNFEVNYLSIRKQYGDGCKTEVVPVNGIQRMFMDPTWCLDHGRIVHELMHSLGFTHEHQRPDRDTYVTILWDNIKAEDKIQFVLKTYPMSLTYGFPYDYTSILHYRNMSNFAAVDTKKPIILPKLYAPDMGQRIGLDQLDHKKINYFYGCEQQKVN